MKAAVGCFFYGRWNNIKHVGGWCNGLADEQAMDTITKNENDITNESTQNGKEEATNRLVLAFVF